MHRKPRAEPFPTHGRVGRPLEPFALGRPASTGAVQSRAVPAGVPHGPSRPLGLGALHRSLGSGRSDRGRRRVPTRVADLGVAPQHDQQGDHGQDQKQRRGQGAIGCPPDVRADPSPAARSGTPVELLPGELLAGHGSSDREMGGLGRERLVLDLNGDMLDAVALLHQRADRADHAGAGDDVVHDHVTAHRVEARGQRPGM